MSEVKQAGSELSGGLGVFPPSTYDSTVKCPWCGKFMRDASELFDAGQEVSETECGWCEKPIRITQLVSVDYRTEAR